MKIALLIILVSMSVFAQITYSGFVYDENKGEAIVGAIVYIKELKRGASTNVAGYFTIPNLKAGKYTIQISSVGYETRIKNIELKNNLSENIYILPTSYMKKEIVVVADSVNLSEKLYTKSLSVVELSPVQISKIPQFVESDLLRSLQTLPGILTISDFSSALYVRGGTPDQNLYLLDGTDVYNPEHAFGFFSTFNTDAIKKVEFIKGGFGAEYGGRLSSVLNVINLDGNRNNFEGALNISLLSSRLTLQTPLSDFGSLSASFRRTYLDAFAAKISDDIPDYYFYDGNLKAFFDLSDKDKLSISFYGGKDNLFYKFDKKKTDSPELTYNWGNRTTSINYRKILSDNLFANIWFTYSNFNSKFNFDEVDAKEKNTIDDVTGKFNFEYYFDEDYSFKIGIENKYMYGLYWYKFSGGLVDFNSHKNYFISYVTSSIKIADNLTSEIGIRYEQFNSDKIYSSLNPRFSIKYRIDESQTLKFATGKYSQYLNKINRGFIVGIWTVADKNVPPSSSNHYILGWTKDINNLYSLEIESYYKTYDKVPVFNQNLILDLESQKSDPITVEPIYNSMKGIFNQSKAYSYGLEILLRKDFGNVTGWLGYSYSHTNNKVYNVNRDKWFIPRQDRTNVVNLVLNTNIVKTWDDIFDNPDEETNSTWLLGVNFTYSTGQLITYPASYYFSGDFPGSEPTRNIYPGEINKYRLPYYMRMDISLTYEKRYQSWSIAPYLQIYNVGNRKNVWFIQYDYTDIDGKFTNNIDTFNQIPFLPTFGVTIKF